MTSAMCASAWPRTRRLILDAALTLLVIGLARPGSAESSSDICISMENSSGQVAGLQAEFQWDHNCMTALTGSNGRPQCNADPSTGKDVHAALTPRGSLKALLFSMSDLSPMPDGNMFCCSFTFEGRPGCCGLTMSNVLGSDPSGGQDRSFGLVATIDGAVCATSTGTGGGGGGGGGAAPRVPAAPMAPPVGAVGGVPGIPAAPGGAAPAPAAPAGGAAPMRRAPGGDAAVPPPAPAGGAAAGAAPEAPAVPTMVVATPQRTPAAAGTPTAARTPGTPKAAPTAKTTPDAAKPTPEGTPGQPTPKAAKATPASH